MIKARLDGLYLMLLGSVVFLSLGAILENATSARMVDFKGLYYPARCLIQHHDPYNESEVLPIYQADWANQPSDTGMYTSQPLFSLRPPLRCCHGGLRTFFG
jgi:hypothetical protein